MITIKSRSDLEKLREAGRVAEDVKNAESISFGNKADEQSMKDYYVLK